MMTRKYSRMAVIGFALLGAGILVGGGLWARGYMQTYAPERRFGDLCGAAIKSRLKSPDSYREDNLQLDAPASGQGPMLYKGFVTYSSQNGFGALIQDMAQCEFTVPSSESTILDSPNSEYSWVLNVKIDGKTQEDRVKEMLSDLQAKAKAAHLSDCLDKSFGQSYGTEAAISDCVTQFGPSAK